jgi:hypothetical protein
MIFKLLISPKFLNQHPDPNMTLFSLIVSKNGIKIALKGHDLFLPRESTSNLITNNYLPWHFSTVHVASAVDNALINKQTNTHLAANVL